jgi:hypothetical protein
VIGKHCGQGGSKVANNQLSQQVFKRGAQIGLVVAILYDYRSVEAQAPLLAAFMTFAFADGA